MKLDMDILLTIGPYIVAGAAAYGGVKVSLNGTKDRIKSVTDALSAHVKEQTTNYVQVKTDIARMETKVDMLLDEMRYQQNRTDRGK